MNYLLKTTLTDAVILVSTMLMLYVCLLFLTAKLPENSKMVKLKKSAKFITVFSILSIIVLSALQLFHISTAKEILTVTIYFPTLFLIVLPFIILFTRSSIIVLSAVQLFHIATMDEILDITIILPALFLIISSFVALFTRSGRGQIATLFKNKCSLFIFAFIAALFTPVSAFFRYSLSQKISAESKSDEMVVASKIQPPII